MKKTIAAVAVFALCISTITSANAAVIATNPTPDLYYLGKTYETLDDWVADAYINIDSVTETNGLDVVVHADIHYDETLIENALELPLYRNEDGTINENYDEAMQEIMAVTPYGRLYAVVQFIRYDTVSDKTTYKQIIHDIVPDKIVTNDLYDTSGGYTCSTDLLYSAGLFFRNECGLNDTNMIIATGNEQGVSVIENGYEIIYKTKIVGVYGYLENSTIKSKQSYKVLNGDLFVCDDYADIQTIIGEQSRQSITDFEENVQTATGEILDTVGSGVAGIMNMLTGLLASVGQVPLLIDSLFVFIPAEIRITMYAIIGIIVIVAILNALP